MSTVGLALIVRDEEENLPRLLESIEGAFDEIVLVDTGSTDGTIEVFENWHQSHDPESAPRYRVECIEWADDFAAARNYADACLFTDWKVWADADDVIVGAQNIRMMVESVGPDVVGFVCGYDYAQHPDTGNCICHLKRERIVRAGHSRWEGRVHEAQIVQGGALQAVPDNIVHWKHQKLVTDPEEAVRGSSERNLRILRRWNGDEPDNPRVVAYLGTELASRGEHIDALGWYQDYLSLPTGWTEERAQVHRKLSASLMALGRDDEALECAFAALDVMPTWPDSYNSLAEIYLKQGEYAKAEFWAKQATQFGIPETLLIINPLEYTFHAWSLLARARAGQGRTDEAVATADEALQAFPDYGLAVLQQEWRATSKREHTANTFAMCAEQLIAHDEQLKAKMLLEQCVPHFATDHPRIVGIRSMLRERLAWVESDEAFAEHYNTGGSKPEDFIPDEQIDELCEALPRTGFLLEGIREQINAY